MKVLDLEHVEAQFGLIIREKENHDNYALLHCVSDYPSKLEDSNMLAMKAMGELFQCVVGYSDHTKNFEVPIPPKDLQIKFVSILKQITISGCGPILIIAIILHIVCL